MIRSTVLAAALTAAFPAFADADLDALRAELKDMRAAYEARIAALEARIEQAGARPAAPPAPPADAAPAGNRFNPDISLILQGRYAHLDDIEARRIEGFLPAGHGAAAARGFSIDGTELILSANIDPYFRGQTILALFDEEVEIEEAWVQTTSLGHGVSVKGGRFRSGLGYQNEKHPHAWDFADSSLMYRALFGEGYGNDGVQLKWLAPTELFVELGAEAGRGANFPGSDRNVNGAGATTLFGHLGGDVGTSHSWRAGVSYLHAKASEREGELEDALGADIDTLFSGKSATWVADFVWKWAPDGNARERNFSFATEYFRRTERGTLCEHDAVNEGCAAASEDAYRARQSGYYAQAVYQFMPRWRTGYRYDRLNPGAVDFGMNPLNFPAVDHKPTRHSLMLDYSPSEFSRLRLQYSKDRSMESQNENQWFVQYIHSLGSHGAHKF
ncbi:MAG: TonB-dependent receptor [Gammaproteobacteria bacterium]